MNQRELDAWGQVLLARQEAIDARKRFEEASADWKRITTEERNHRVDALEHALS